MNIGSINKLKVDADAPVEKPVERAEPNRLAAPDVEVASLTTPVTNPDGGESEDEIVAAPLELIVAERYMPTPSESDTTDEKPAEPVSDQTYVNEEAGVLLEESVEVPIDSHTQETAQVAAATRVGFDAPDAAPVNPFDIAGGTLRPGVQETNPESLDFWWDKLHQEAIARKATVAQEKSLGAREIEQLAREVFSDISAMAQGDGIRLPEDFQNRLIGELSGLGPLLALIARPGVEDIAINLGHIYVYTTGEGWTHTGPAPDGIGDAIRVLMDRAGQRPPSPDYPVADAMLQVMVPDGARPKGRASGSTTSCRRRVHTGIRSRCESQTTGRNGMSVRAR